MSLKYAYTLHQAGESVALGRRGTETPNPLPLQTITKHNTYTLHHVCSVADEDLSTSLIIMGCLP